MRAEGAWRWRRDAPGAERRPGAGTSRGCLLVPRPILARCPPGPRCGDKVRASVWRGGVAVCRAPEWRRDRELGPLAVRQAPGRALGRREGGWSRQDPGAGRLSALRGPGLELGGGVESLDPLGKRRGSDRAGSGVTPAVHGVRVVHGLVWQEGGPRELHVPWAVEVGGWGWLCLHQTPAPGAASWPAASAARTDGSPAMAQQRALPQSKETLLQSYNKRLKDDIKSMMDNFTEIIKTAKVGGDRSPGLPCSGPACPGAPWPGGVQLQGPCPHAENIWGHQGVDNDRQVSRQTS